VKILLLNDNPVVNKLVTLSAQKSSDALDVSDSIDAISSLTYDLVVVDDGIGGEDVLDKLKEKLNFSKSLYICARDAKELKGFDSTLKKPFLPTDLVELFATISKDVANMDSQALKDTQTHEVEDAMSVPTKKHNDIEDLDDLKDLEEFDEVALDEELELDEDLLDLDIAGDDTLILESDDMLLDDDISLEDDENLGESILDDEEAQKVKDLLDETSDDVSEEDSDEPEVLEELEELNNLDEPEALEELAESDESDNEPLDELEEPVEEESAQELNDLDEPETVDELEDLVDDTTTEELEEEAEEKISDKEEGLDNIELQIQDAVDNLTEEDLESEIDQDTLLGIATNEIDSLDNLTSKDMKLALGEEVDEPVTFEEEISDENLESIIDESLLEAEEPETKPEGIEALKKLLTALSDKDVAASMKGMKITVSIELGDA